MLNRLFFNLRYWLGRPPWDTGITPPEVVALIEGGLPPGRALDLGCGTGTNSLYLARHGWEVTGVDFVARAIQQARRKAREAEVRVDLHLGEVTDLSWLAPPFHFALDVGCFHSLARAGREAYAKNLRRLLAPGALLLMYAFLNEPSGELPPGPGLPRSEILEVFESHFTLAKVEEGTGRPSAWFTFQRMSI